MAGALLNDVSSYLESQYRTAQLGMSKKKREAPVTILITVGAEQN